MAVEFAGVDFEELRRRTQDNLVNFLKVELELAETMYGMVERAPSYEHKERLVENVRQAIQAIHHFEGRISDQSSRKELIRDTARLEEYVAGGWG